MDENVCPRNVQHPHFHVYSICSYEGCDDDSESSVVFVISFDVANCKCLLHMYVVAGHAWEAGVESGM